MPSNRDTVLTDFVRYKIQEWKNSGREQKELARIAGLKSASSVSMIQKSMGVGAKTAPGFAKAFGFTSVAAMTDAAYEWRKGTGAELEDLLSEKPVQIAMRQVPGFVGGTTEASLKGILSAFTAPRFRGRDVEYWVETLAREAKRDALADVALKSEKADDRRAEAARVRVEEGAWRSAAAEKEKLAEAKQELHRREQAVEAAVVKQRRKKKISGVVG